MDPQEIVNLYSKDSDTEDALAYLESENVIKALDPLRHSLQNRIPPNYRDLARLHKAICARRVFTILEFGLGYSTIVMADALLKNQSNWDALPTKSKIRNSTPFQLHSVDTSSHWLEATQSMLPAHLADLVTLHHPPAKASTFQDRTCHFYEKLPDVIPDFIYLDGPDPATVIGDIGGSTWSNPDRVVASGDLLRIEHQLLPGTLIIIDGRTANARFLCAHFYRNWQMEHSDSADVTVIELKEEPLGKYNQATIAYCSGSTS